MKTRLLLAIATSTLALTACSQAVASTDDLHSRVDELVSEKGYACEEPRSGSATHDILSKGIVFACHKDGDDRSGDFYNAFYAEDPYVVNDMIHFYEDRAGGIDDGGLAGLEIAHGENWLVLTPADGSADLAEELDGESFSLQTD